MAILWYAKKVSETQKEFINNLTHDFKTPLFTISIAAYVIKNTTDPKKNNTYVQVIKNESATLARQVDNVLQQAVIEAGYFQLEKKEVDIKKMIEKMVDSFSVLVEANGGSVVSEIHTTTSHIMADEFHLQNALYNLLDNAVKFSPNSLSIHILVCMRALRSTFITQKAPLPGRLSVDRVLGAWLLFAAGWQLSC